MWCVFKCSGCVVQCIVDVMHLLVACVCVCMWMRRWFVVALVVSMLMVSSAMYECAERGTLCVSSCLCGVVVVHA